MEIGVNLIEETQTSLLLGTKKMLKNIFFVVALATPLIVSAQVTHVTLWEPLPGKFAEMIAVAKQGVAISETLGTKPALAVDTHNRLHYITSFENWKAWGDFQSKASSNADMQSFIAGYTAKPSAKMLKSFMLNEPLSGVPGAVYQVFVWQAYEGRSEELMAKAIEASKLHLEAGAGIGINVDQLGRLHYVMSFDSWSLWGKFQDSPTPEWTSYWTTFNEDPPGKVIETYMANQISD